MYFKKVVINITCLAIGLLLIINVFTYLGDYHYRFEQLTHFRLQYLVLFVVATLLFILFSNKKWLALSLLGLFSNAIPVLSIYLPPEVQSVEKNKQISLLLTNVLSNNQSYAALLQKIELKQADIIVVLELTPQWANELKAVDRKYPYQKLIPRRDNFGIGLYSKYPLEDISVLDFARNDIPSISASIQFKTKVLNVIATHPIPPLNKSFSEQQRIHLENLADFVRSKKVDARSIKTSAVLIAADLNSTQWSSRYKALVSSTGLYNTRQGIGLNPSWPDGEGVLGYLLQLPLDHVLVTKNIGTQIFERLGSINSDHFPVYIKLQF